MEAISIKLFRFTCLRCGHRWIPRGDRVPRTCPNRACHSPYWQTKRKIKKGED